MAAVILHGMKRSKIRSLITVQIAVTKYHMKKNNGYDLGILVGNIFGRCKTKSQLNEEFQRMLKIIQAKVHIREEQIKRGIN